MKYKDINGWEQDDENTWIKQTDLREYTLMINPFKGGFTLVRAWMGMNSQGSNQTIVGRAKTRAEILKKAYAYMEKH